MPVVAAVALEALIAAILPLILLLATEVFGTLIVGLVPSVRIPGIGNLHDIAQNWLNHLLTAEWQSLDAEIHPMVDLFDGLGKALGWVFGGIETFLYDLYLLVVFLFADALPAVVRWAYGGIEAVIAALGRVETSIQNWVTQLVGQVYANLVAFVEAVATSTLSHVNGEIAYLANWTAGQFAAMTRWVQELAGTLAAQVNAQIGALVHYVQAVAAQLSADLVNAVRALVAYVDNGLTAANAHANQVGLESMTAAVAAVDVQARTGAGPGWPGLAQAAHGVAADAGTDFGANVAGLADVADVAPADVAVLAAELTAVTHAMLDLTRRCTIPNCRNLSKLGREWQALQAVMGAGFIWELVHAAATDPEGTARTVASSAGPILREGATLVEDLVGVHP